MKLHCQKLRLLMFIASAFYNSDMKAEHLCIKSIFTLRKSTKKPQQYDHT